MANELNIIAPLGQTWYAVIRSGSQFANGTTLENYNAGHWANYAVAMADGNSLGSYIGSMPALAAGMYRVDYYKQAGGSPATSDGPAIGQDEFYWTGTAKGQTNLDAAISSRLAASGYTTPPTKEAIRTEMDTNSTKLDVVVSTRAAPGAKMDLVDAPNSTAVTAIQNGLATSTQVNNLNNLSALVNIYGPPVLEIPDSSSTLYPFTITFKTLEGLLEDCDGAGGGTITLSAANASGTDRSANLSGITHVQTGVYSFTYSVASTAVKEGVRIKASAAVGASPRYIEAIVAVEDFDSVTAIAAIKAKTDQLTFTVANQVNANTKSVGDVAQTGSDLTQQIVSLGTSVGIVSIQVGNLASTLSDIQGAGFDTNNDSLHVISALATGFHFDGAFATTIHVKDGSNNPIQGATVAIQLNSDIEYDHTDASGNVATALDAATYTLRVTCPGYAGYVGSLPVVGAGSTTVTLTAITFSPPAAPGLVTGWAQAFRNGTLTPGITATALLITPPNVNGIYDRAEFSAQSDSNGTWTYTSFLPGGRYLITSGGREFRVTIPSNAVSPYALPVVL